MKKFTSDSVAATEAFAAELAKTVPMGTVILLNGDLGAGKTAFARGFARALGITEPVSSPTFTIVQEYPFAKGTLYHMDLYRINSADSALAFGIDEFLFNPASISLVEWPERAEGVYPAGKTMRIDIVRHNEEPDIRFFEVGDLE